VIDESGIEACTMRAVVDRLGDVLETHPNFAPWSHSSLVGLTPPTAPAATWEPDCSSWGPQACSRPPLPEWIEKATGNVVGQVEIYDRLTRRLQAAGARTVAVTSIAGHFCIDAFTEVSVLPVIDLLGVVAAGINAAGYRRVGLLGTRGVMASRFYGALGDVEVVVPPVAGLDAVHDAYVSVASVASCTPEQRGVFFDAGRALVDEHGAEAVVLAGTDLALAFNGHDPGFTTFDCIDAHVSAIVEHALRRDL
jgi:aspartate racemase